MKLLTGAIFAVLLLGLVVVASQSMLLAVVAMGAAGAVAAIAVVGPGTLGTALIVVAMFTAPMDDVRPVATSIVTASDVAFALGFLLLVQTMLRRRAHIPVLFAVGAAIMVATTMIATLLSPDPGDSLQLAARLVAAVILLPLALAFWAPSLKVVDVLAWAYVAGQVVSTGWGLVEGTIQGRYYGLTRHQNFFGLGAMVAVALALYLYTRTPREHRWLVWVAGGICAYGGLISGSRSATLVIVLMAVMFPLVERSAVSAYVVIAGGITLALSLDWLADYLGPGSAVARLLPGDFGASLSNRAREVALETYWPRFLDNPLLGEGFQQEHYAVHNAYLQMALAIGIFGLAGFVMLGWSLMRPLFEGGPRHGLGYVALAYAAIAPITPSIWDRLVWAGLALAILASVTDDADDDSPDTTEQPIAQPSRRIEEVT